MFFTAAASLWGVVTVAEGVEDDGVLVGAVVPWLLPQAVRVVAPRPSAITARTKPPKRGAAVTLGASNISA